MFLYLRMPAFCLILIPVAIMQVKRAKTEERVLTEKFGNSYLRYKQGTWL